MELTNVGSVDEAEQIQQGDGRDDHKVNLSSQLGLGAGVKLDQGVAVSVDDGVSGFALVPLARQEGAY